MGSSRVAGCRGGIAAFRSKAVRVVVAVVMALAMVPAVSVAQAFAAQPKFIGYVNYVVDTDEDGYPVYGEDGTLQRTYAYVTIKNVENASGTLVIPESFDVTVRAEDGTEMVEKNVKPSSLRLGGTVGVTENGLRPTWTNKDITSIDLTQVAALKNAQFDKLEAVTSVKLDGLKKLNSVWLWDSDVLTSVSMEGCSLKSFGLDGCAAFAQPDFSQPFWKSLTNLKIANRDDFTSFDDSCFPNLEQLNIYRTPISSIDVSACAKLKYLLLSDNELTELDAATIPASVEVFFCQRNNLTDTAALVERFGEQNVFPQNDDEPQPSGVARLVVIGESEATSTFLPGHGDTFSLYGSYTPGMDEQGTWWKDSQDSDATYAASNFTAVSSDASIVQVKIETNEFGGSVLALQALKAGTATLTIDYRYAAEDRVYSAQQKIDFTVASDTNPIASISCDAKAEVPFISKCALCGEAHVSVDGGITVPLTITAQDTSRPFTRDSSLKAVSADTSVVYASIEQEFSSGTRFVRLNPHKVGTTTVTIAAETAVDGQLVSTDPVTIQVSVFESPKPTLNVSDTYSTVYYQGSNQFISYIGSGNYSGAISSYEDNSALEEVENWHGNNFESGSSVTVGDKSVQVIKAVSDNDAVIAVAPSGREGTLDIKGPGTAHVTVSDIWGNEGTCTITVLDIKDQAAKLSLSKNELSIKVGETADLMELVQGAENVDPLLADRRLVFKTSNGYLAPVKFDDTKSRNLSVITGRSVGDVTVTAGMFNGSDMGGALEDLDTWRIADFGILTVHVVPADTPADNPATAVEVIGDADTVEMGSTLQLWAVITPDDASDAGTLAWSSSDETVATVDKNGKVTPVASGTATITAKVGAVSGTFEVTVVIPSTNIIVSRPESFMTVGSTQQLTATLEPADSTDTVTWGSTDEAVLTVDQSGLVTAVGNGMASIWASAGKLSVLAGPITVTTPVSGVMLDKQALELYVGADASQLVATVAPATASYKGVDWASSDSAVATVDENGKVTPVAPGTATIKATTHDGGFTATCEVTVKQHVEGIALDTHELTLTGVQTAALKATVSPDNATNKGVTWESSDEGVAAVDADGNVEAVGKGTATITATTEDGAFSDTCAVTVKNPATKLTLDPASLSLIKGETADVDFALTGELAGAVDENNGVTWSSSNAEVATVAGGTVTAVASGAATITAEATVSGAKLTGTCAVAVTNPVQKVTVSEVSKSATVGDGTFTLSAAVTPSDADDTKVTWASSNAKVATVDVNGMVTIRATGTANIVASAGGKSAACALTVKAKEMAQTPQGSGFAASVVATDAETVKALEQLAGDGGLNLVVDSIAQLTAPAKEAVEKLTADGAVVADTFDIHFAADDGQEIVLEKNDEGHVVLTVRVKLTDSMRTLLDQGMKLQVHYVGDDGTVEDKETWVEDGFLCFVTEHFSDYVVTGVPQKEEGGKPVTPPADDGKDKLAPTDGGSELAPTGDPLAGAVPVAACLLFGALVCAGVASAHMSRRQG